jgi:hypothetical protein
MARELITIASTLEIRGCRSFALLSLVATAAWPGALILSGRRGWLGCSDHVFRNFAWELEPLHLRAAELLAHAPSGLARSWQAGNSLERRRKKQENKQSARPARARHALVAESMHALPFLSFNELSKGERQETLRQTPARTMIAGGLQPAKHTASAFARLGSVASVAAQVLLLIAAAAGMDILLRW